MRRLLAALAVFLCLAPAGASAQALWRMEAFRSDVIVRADGVIEVRETIGAEFLAERHGIYRYIPVEGKDDQGQDYRLDVGLNGVWLDGQPERVDASRKGDQLVWKIGKEETTLRGSHEYVIEYEVRGAIGRFQDMDEIYWNATGEGWDVPLPIAAATVTLPEGVATLSSACYTGPYGSTAQDCTIIEAPGSVGFVTKNEGDPMTVAVGFPKGLVAEPPPPSFLETAAAAAARFLPFLLPLAALIFMYRRWKKHGDDAEFGAIVTQYESPAGLRPAEANALLRQMSVPGDIAVTIVDLAVRGYVRIEEKKTKGILGIGGSTDHVLHLMRDHRNDLELKPFETKLLEDLFGPENPPPAQVTVSSLKGTFHMKAKEFQEKLMEHLTAEGYFEMNPNKARSVYLGIGSLFFLPLIIFMRDMLGAAIAASGLIVMLFGSFMAKWSAKGHAAAESVKGYKEFIGAVEKYRAPWMETQDMFEKTLPYAMAFGLGSRWAAAFAPLNLPPPTWYQGAAIGATWSPVDFEKSLNGWSDSMIAASSPPRSSGSGSGGGGFSGGGGGGGGGGSW
ncbi:MAG TPA: DUF2207 domain-containing protein [Candidatus Baltobacteraceae bacterium]|nr:DUF2207 domain-containing protein [Candidatus Baltobacteraceae bacterium]